MDMLQRATRRERILDLWAAGGTAPEIADMVYPTMSENAVGAVVRKARDEGDARAMRRKSDIDIQTLLRDHGDEIMQMWGVGCSAEIIAGATGITIHQVYRVLQKARVNGDKRALRQGERALMAAEDVLDADECEPPCGKAPVTLPIFSIQRAQESLKPLAYSVEREERGMKSMTAQLMGDPPPERSALQRECLPHEYASKPGQGRWRDPCLGVSANGGAGLRHTG